VDDRLVQRSDLSRLNCFSIELCTRFQAMTKVFDRRQKKRIPYSGTICLLPVNQEKTVMADIMDLSASGLRVRSSDSIKVNSEILCDIPIDKDRLALKGRIVWCDKGDHLDAGMGIEFVDLSTNDEAKLSHLVNARIRKHNSVKVWFEGMKTPVLAEAESIPDGIRLYTSLPFLRLNSPVGFKFYYDRFGKPVRGNVKRVTLNSSSTDPVPRLLIDLDPDQVVDLSGLLAGQSEPEDVVARESDTQMLFENVDARSIAHHEGGIQADQNAFSDVTPVHSFQPSAQTRSANATQAGIVGVDPRRSSVVNSTHSQSNVPVGEVKTAGTTNDEVRSGEISALIEKFPTNKYNRSTAGEATDSFAPVEINERSMEPRSLGADKLAVERSFNEDAKRLESSGVLRTRVRKLSGVDSAEELEAILGFGEDEDELRRLNARKQRFLWVAALGLFCFGLYMALNSGVFKRRPAHVANVVVPNATLNGTKEAIAGASATIAIRDIDRVAGQERGNELEAGGVQDTGAAVVEERSWNRDDIAINASKSGTATRTASSPKRAQPSQVPISDKLAQGNSVNSSKVKPSLKSGVKTSAEHSSSGKPSVGAPVIRAHDGKTVASVPISGSLVGAHHYPLADPRGVVVMLPKAKPTIPYKDYGALGAKFRTIWVRKRDTGGVQLRFIFAVPGQRYSVSMAGDHVSVKTL